MGIIIVSDIFGKTPALENLCKELGSNVDIIDPYAGKYMGFKTEQIAYDFFMSNVGLNSYSQVLQSKLENELTPPILIGFSIGASVIWQISESFSKEKIKHVVCFYGSQIRNFMEVNPNVIVDILLPKYEPGFNVEELARLLSVKENIILHKTPYLHGFMNKLSKNYSKVGYCKYVNWLREKAC